MGQNILIIGNGFDLYHKLPTRYSDFMFFATEWETFYREYDLNSQQIEPKKIRVPLSEKGELTQESLIEFAKYSEIYNKECIEFLNNSLKKNTWIKYFNEIENSEEMRWVDFEAEIYNALIAVEEYSMEIIPQSTNGVVEGFFPTRLRRIPAIFGKAADNGYINMTKKQLTINDLDPPRLQANKELLIDFICRELDDLIKCLDYYFSEFVENICCECYSEQIESLKDIDLLSFNYTDIYRQIYRSTSLNEYHAVHGGVKNHDIVLGIADDTFDGKPEYIRFQKFFQRIQKRTGAFYLKWFDERNCGFLSLKTVYIMGHSLGYADFGVLEPFFTKPVIQKIVIYYHDQKSYENLVINLVKALGKEKVIDEIGKEKIVFEKLTAPQICETI